jgi:tRNA A-37 threonylcarbamoyl transferase component Bud32
MSAKVIGVTPKCLRLRDSNGIEYEMRDIIGEGQFGKVLLTCKTLNCNTDCCNYAAKFVKIGKVPTKQLRSKKLKRTEHLRSLYSVKKEIRIQKQAAELGIAPRVFGEFECEDYYIFIMEMIPKSYISLRDFEKKYGKSGLKSIMPMVYNAIKLLNDDDIEHNDLHKGNIMVDKETNHVLIIDYGMAEIKRGIKFDEVERFKDGEYEMIE